MSGPEPEVVPRDAVGVQRGLLGGPRRIGYGAVLLAFRLLVAAFALLWVPFAEPSSAVVSIVLPTWYAQAVFVCAYCLYSVLTFAASARHPRVHGLGSFLDLVLAAVVLAVSGGAGSPAYAVLVMIVGLSGYHFGLTIALLQGLVAAVLWVAVCYQDLAGLPWLATVFFLSAPTMMGMLAGVLRQGVTGRQSHESLKARLAETYGHLLAADLALLPLSPTGDRAAGVGSELEHSLGLAWEAAEVVAAVVAARGADGALRLAGVYRCPELGGDLGRVLREDAAIPEAAPGAHVSSGPPECLREIREASAALSAHEVTSVVAADTRGAWLVVLAARRRGAEPAAVNATLSALVLALESMGARAREQSPGAKSAKPLTAEGSSW